MEASPEPKESSSHQVQPTPGCWRSSRPFSFVQWHKHQCTARPTLVSPKAYITMYMEDNNAPPRVIPKLPASHQAPGTLQDCCLTHAVWKYCRRIAGPAHVQHHAWESRTHQGHATGWFSTYYAPRRESTDLPKKFCSSSQNSGHRHKLDYSTYSELDLRGGKKNKS